MQRWVIAVYGKPGFRREIPLTGSGILGIVVCRTKQTCCVMPQIVHDGISHSTHHQHRVGSGRSGIRTVGNHDTKHRTDAESLEHVDASSDVNLMAIKDELLQVTAQNADPREGRLLPLYAGKGEKK